MSRHNPKTTQENRENTKTKQPGKQKQTTNQKTPARRESDRPASSAALNRREMITLYQLKLGMAEKQKTKRPIYCPCWLGASPFERWHLPCEE